MHKFVFHRRNTHCMYFAVSWSRGLLRACIRSVRWSVRRQKLMLAHLVAFRSGLWWQTAGDKEESSALQLRTVPTEHLRLTNHESRVCAGFSIFWRGALFVFMSACCSLNRNVYLPKVRNKTFTYIQPHCRFTLHNILDNTCKCSNYSAYICVCTLKTRTGFCNLPCVFMMSLPDSCLHPVFMDTYKVH